MRYYFYNRNMQNIFKYYFIKEIDMLESFIIGYFASLAANKTPDIIKNSVQRFKNFFKKLMRGNVIPLQTEPLFERIIRGESAGETEYINFARQIINNLVDVDKSTDKIKDFLEKENKQLACNVTKGNIDENTGVSIVTSGSGDITVNFNTQSRKKKVKEIVNDVSPRNRRIAAQAFPNYKLPVRNRRFSGRDDEMARINAALKKCSTTLIIGQGGFGKTQIAVKYAYRHAKEYDYICYFNAESETRLSYECREFALTIGMPEDWKNDSRRVNSYISNWFNRNKSLFIYDNAEGCPKLCEYQPQGFYSGHIIFNSRDDLKGNFGERINATVFSHDDAMKFIRKHVDGVIDDEAQKLAYSLGYLPLALEQAVSCMEFFGYSCAGYLGLLESKGLDVLDKPSKNTDYDKTVTTTWNITFERLEKDAQSDSLSLATVQLLNLCAYCAPDDIPLRMFIEGREQLPQPLRDVLAPDNLLGHDDVVGKLKGCSLVSMRRDDGGIMLTIHRLIQAVVNRRLCRDTRWLSYCLDAMHSIFAYVHGDRQSMDAFGRNLPHALEIARHTESTFRDDNKRHEKVAYLYNIAGYGLRYGGAYAEALVWYRKALGIRERVLGAEHPDTATSYNNIATVYHGQGKYEEALVWYRKALGIRERVLGEEHPDTATSYNNIAMVYKNQGKYEEALTLYLKSYRITLAKLGETHPTTAKIKSNMKAAYAESDFNKPFDDWLRNSL